MANLQIIFLNNYKSNLLLIIYGIYRMFEFGFSIKINDITS